MLVNSISFDQQDIIILKLEVALIIDIKVLASGSSHVDRSEELKVKVLLNQGPSLHLGLAPGIQLYRIL
jgi:hypothetical protein